MSLALFMALYCLEAGVFLTIVPWTRIWTLNPLLHNNLTIGFWADNPYVRGFVSGVGVVHIIIGVKDIVMLTRAAALAKKAP
ncbi:MAG TPA: hypothetical protein VMS98_14515 [Thermoanaerobaculia bacterium]|nr:hypothetical protein [Thermoanaerobaculia bacterium]